MSRIFIGHSSVNNAQALALGKWLEECGWDDYFLDIDPVDGLVPGERWREALRKAVNRCEVVLFLVSPAWQASTWCQTEVRLATTFGKPVIGVVIEPTPTASLAPELTYHTQLCDLAGGEQRRVFDVARGPLLPPTSVSFAAIGLESLRLGLQRLGVAAESFPWPPPLEPTRVPYRGMKPLGPEDAAVFFGREAPTIAGLDSLRRLCDRGSSGLFVIVGASGAGKSSFLRAGLWPRLDRDDRRFLILPVIRPQRAAISGPEGLLHSLVEAFRRAERPRSRSELRQALERPEGLGDLLAELLDQRLRRAEASTKPPVVVLAIDQAEELFAAEGRDESDPFVQQLGRVLASSIVLRPALAAEDAGVDAAPARAAAERARFLGAVSGALSPPPVGTSVVTVVALMAIRSESIEQLQQEPVLTGVPRALFDLAPMDEFDFRAVIERPAARARDDARPLELTPDLVQRLLRDTTGRDALPLLAFTLERLLLEFWYAKWTSAEYERIGGVGGAIAAAIEDAFKEPARDPVVPADADARLALLRRAFVPWLATVDPDTDVRRRVVAKRSDIPEASRAVVQRLIDDARLLRRDTTPADEGFGDVVVEIAHEALLRQWAPLVGWLRDESEHLKQLEQVLRDSRDWEKNGRSDDWLGHQGARLDDAERLLTRDDFKARLGSAGESYLAACRARQQKTDDERIANEEERDRAARREREDAQRLAAAAAEVKASALRVRNRSFVAAALVIVAAAISGLFFVRARDQAVRLQKGVVVRGGELMAATDPTTAAAVLASLPPEPEVDGAVAAAIRVLDEPIATILRGHKRSVRSARFDRSGTRVVTAGADGTARVWRVDGTGGSIDLPHWQSPIVESAVFNPQGTKVLTVADSAYLWNADGSGQPQPLGKLGTTVVAAAFDAAGERVLTAAEDGRVRAFRTDGEEVLTLSLVSDRLLSADFDRAGAQVVITTANTVHIWTLVPEKREIALNAPGVTNARFVNDGKDVVAWGGGVVWIWKASGAGGALKLRDIEKVVVSADGRAVMTMGMWGYQRYLLETRKGEPVPGTPGASASPLVGCGGSWVGFVEERSVLTWPWPDWKNRRSLNGHSGALRDVAFNVDCTRVVTASDDGTARVWSLPRPRPLTTAGDRRERLWDGSVSRDGRRLVTFGMAQSNVASVDVSSLPEFQGVFSVGTEQSAKGLLSPNGRQLLVVSGDELRVWLPPGREAVLVCTSGGSIGAFKFSPDGNSVFFNDRFSLRRSSMTEPCKRAIEYQPPLKGIITSVSVSPDGRRVLAAATSGDGRVVVWNVDDSARPKTLTPKEGINIQQALFGASADQVLTIDDKGTVQQWSLSNWSAPEVVRTDVFGEVTLATPSSRGHYALLALVDGTVRVWPFDGSSSPAPLTGHTQPALRMVTSEDERYLLTSSGDGTVRMWRMDGTELPIVLERDTDVVGVGFAGGTQIVTIVQDATIRMRPLEWRALLARLKTAAANCLTPEERRTHLVESPADAERVWLTCEAGYGRAPRPGP